MTTILLPTFGSSGDVNPFIVLGREFQRRGHRAILITNPHFRDKIEAAGLEFMGVGDEQLPATLADGVRHCPFAPFDRLLPRTAALVYHGGVGTLAQALAAGIPHLVTPMGHDQPDNARRLERLGVGKTLPPKKFTAERVAAALDALLDDEAVGARCRELAGRVDFKAAVGETCDLIVVLESF